MECPFLSTVDETVECFRECALYNYKHNDGECPFKSLEYNKLKIEEDFDKLDNDPFIVEGMDFIAENYSVTNKHYL
ncbi:hypothetical protein FDF74_04115 [Clostridium niameyense]|uniref:Uncharacterized protein n=1 Tax=Clostridium niameyense TaxID=1622073 RepID=A0A6M0RAY7_9CLOT|nr:hypothetical protein [Clostridium niameyense]NEZ46398.1 hypothetical protein [Clostridium niameyense]